MYGTYICTRESSRDDCAPGSTYASLLSRWATHWRALFIIVALQQRQGIAASCCVDDVVWASAPPRVGRSIMSRRRREPGPDLFLIEGAKGGSKRERTRVLLSWLTRSRFADLRNRARQPCALVNRNKEVEWVNVSSNVGKTSFVWISRFFITGKDKRVWSIKIITSK